MYYVVVNVFLLFGSFYEYWGNFYKIYKVFLGFRLGGCIICYVVVLWESVVVVVLDLEVLFGYVCMWVRGLWYFWDLGFLMILRNSFVGSLNKGRMWFCLN